MSLIRLARIYFLVQFAKSIMCFILFILQEEIKEALEEVCNLLPSTVESEVNV